jgi:WD40 repeat protein
MVNILRREVTKRSCVNLPSGRVDEDTVHSAAFSPNGMILASASIIARGGIGSIRLWNMEKADTPCLLVVLPKLLAGSEIFSVAFSSDGKTLAAGGGREFFACGIPKIMNQARSSKKTGAKWLTCGMQR